MTNTLIDDEGFVLWRTYFNARDKGLLENTIVCPCGESLYLTVHKGEVWKPQLTCYYCQSSFLPGLALRDAAIKALSF